MPPQIADHIKEKAIQLRVEKNLKVREIAEMLSVSVGKVSEWLRDYPARPREKVRTPAQLDADERNRERAAAKRQEAYDEGWAEAPELFKDPEFRDFINLYLAEGFAMMFRLPTQTRM